MIRLNSKQCCYYTTVARSLNSSSEDAPGSAKTQISAPALNPLFVTGFTDAEGSFMVSFTKSSESRHGFRIRAIFQIQLHKKDLELLKTIQAFFQGIGYISSSKEFVSFRARSLDDLQVIIAHFDKFPLKTKKQADFELFKWVVKKLSLKEHLSLKGFKEIVSIRASMNLGLTDALNKAFPEVSPVPRPTVKDEKVINPDWLAGFVTGEGCFFINISTSASNKIGFQVFFLFALTQHTRDKSLLEAIKDYLDCGAVKESSSRMNVLTLKVVKFNDISEKIVPLFNQYKILGVKSEDFNSWCQAIELVKDKNHLTSKGLEEIRQIKSGMNTGRPVSPEKTVIVSLSS